jgi:membrane-associated phospholipid phosphatase
MRAFPAVAFALAFVVTTVVALHTGRGLHDDDALFRHVSGTELVHVRAAGRRALDAVDVVLALVLVVAVARRRLARALAAAFVVGLSVGSAELLKATLPHPAFRPPTYPSGHVSVAVSLGLALVICVPATARLLAALAGSLYAAGIALAVVVLGWHYPSDAVGAFCVAGFWASVAVAVLPTRVGLTRGGAVVAGVAAVLAVVVAVLVAGRHPEAAAALRTRRALVATAVAFGLVSLATFGLVTPFAEERE